MGNKPMVLYSKPLIAISLLFQYYLDRQKSLNYFVLIAFLFAMLGDMFYNFNNQITKFLGLGSFLIFSLAFMIVISYRTKEIKVNRFILYMLPFVAVLAIAMIFFFDYSNLFAFLYFIVGIVVTMLGAYCVFYFLKERNKKSLFYLIGYLLFLVAAFARVINEFDNYTNFVKVVDNLSYMFSLFFFYKAAVIKVKDP